eukprot:9275950-Pyramimonas_sp.AAC.1
MAGTWALVPTMKATRSGPGCHCPPALRGDSSRSGGGGAPHVVVVLVEVVEVVTTPSMSGGTAGASRLRAAVLPRPRRGRCRHRRQPCGA